MKTKPNTTRTILLSLTHARVYEFADAGQPPTVRPLPQKQIRQQQPVQQKHSTVRIQRPQRQNQNPPARVVSPRNNGGGGGYTRPDNTPSTPNLTAFKNTTPTAPPYPGIVWSSQRTPPRLGNDAQITIAPQVPASPIRSVPGEGRVVIPAEPVPEIQIIDRVPVAFTETMSATDSNLQAEADMLREAYVTMSKASHIYHGHRWQAMIQTARAGAILGIRLRGDGRGNTTRQISDQMLRDAKNILERVHSLLVGKNKPAAAQHVRNAINQLNICLAQS